MVMSILKLWSIILVFQVFISLLLSAPVPGPPPPPGPGSSPDCEDNELPGHEWDRIPNGPPREAGPPCVREQRPPESPCEEDDSPGHEIPGGRPLDRGPNRRPCH